MCEASATINDANVLSDYHAALIPEAIKYVAGLLDYYFRGQFDVLPYYTNTDSLIHVKITNRSGQAFTGGQFMIFGDAPDGSGKRTQIQPFQATGAPWTTDSVLADGDSQVFSFCPPSPMPAQFIVVFQGTIGIDADGNPLDPVDAGIGIAANKFTPAQIQAAPPPATYPVMQNVSQMFSSYDAGGAPVYVPAAPIGNAPPMVNAVPNLLTTTQNTMDNTFQATGQSISPAPANQFGFKNLAAAKYWFGRLPFNGVEGCDGGYAAAPNGTRYRTKSMVATSEGGIYAADSPMPFLPLSTATTARRYTIGRLTGIVSETAKTDTGYPADSVGFDGAHKAAQFDYQCGQWWDVVGLGGGVVDALNGVVNPYVIVNYQNATSTSLSFDVTVLATGSYDRYTATIILSDPYTSDDWNADVDALLGQWNLADDAVYPWRQDGLGNFAPLVTYDEVAGHDVNQFTLPGQTWSDLHTGRYRTAPTGHVIGAPLAPGYQPYFDATAKTFVPNGANQPLVLQSTGEFAPDWCPHATQWMNKWQAQSASAGAWAYCRFVPSEQLPGDPWAGRYVKCAWAETMLYAKPSHNYLRPCGPADAAALNESLAYCDNQGVLQGPKRFGGLVVPNPCPAAPPGSDAWNGAKQQGDFIWKEWQYNFRDSTLNPQLRPITLALSAFLANQGQAPPMGCCPAVVYIAPAGKPYPFPNAQRYSLPRLTLDENFGSLWQARPEQWMVDPLWQTPHKPCNLGGTDPWNLDDGTGTGQYFPPYEEARTGPPPGAPPYPGGFGVNYANYVSLRNLGANLDYPECHPPAIGTCDNARWILWANQLKYCTWDAPPGCVPH